MTEKRTPGGWITRASQALDRAEGFYLRVLRGLILAIATILLVYAAWLGASSLYNISRSPDSVKEVEASVLADELTDAQMPLAIASDDQAKTVSADPVHRAFYSSFVSRYFTLYRSRFETYRKNEDKQLSKAEFEGAFFDTASRLEAIGKGELNFESEKADLQKLLAVMKDAADKPATIARLDRYKKATKVAVKVSVQRSRETQERGWDSYSTACPNWFENPVGCSTFRTVQTPYVETVTKMQYPEGTQSHTDIFRAFQNRFFELLQQRREANANKAEQERRGIIEGVANGQLSLVTALQILGGFLVLMFFFLLIAIERHQRKLARGHPSVA